MVRIIRGDDRGIRAPWVTSRDAGLDIPSLRGNFFYTFLGNAVYGGCQWLLLIILAKMRDPEGVGAFALALALTAPVSLFCDLRLRVLEATDVNNKYEFKDYLGLRLVTACISWCVCALLSLLPAYQPHSSVIMAVATFKSIESISDILYGLMQKYERMDLIALSLILKGVAPLISMTIVLTAGGSVAMAALSVAAVWFCLLVTVDIRNARSVLPHRRLLSVRMPSTSTRAMLYTSFQLARLAMPLGLVAMVSSLTASVPKYLIYYYLGGKQLGYFTAIAYLTVVMGRVIVALGDAIIPRLSQLYDANSSAFAGLLIRSSGIVVLTSLIALTGSIMFGRQLLTMLFKPDYAAYNGILIWMMCAAAIDLIGYNFGHGLVVARYLRTRLLIAVGTTVVTAAGCSVLIPAYGLQGAAWAMGVGAITQLMGSLYASRGIRSEEHTSELQS